MHTLQDQRLVTLGEIARDMGLPLHRLTYALKTYHVRETQRAGVIRLFDAAAVERVKAAVRRIDKGSWI
ncbi:MAG: hypothetical protein JXQ73_02445 [Phycisphaerae bacterium]|nr:hypothetical protein [Phycisphaerae bacterium]